MNIEAVARAGQARVPVEEAAALPIASKFSRDTLLGGRVHLSQPVDGFRAAIDPILLAAAIAANPGETVIDLGTGSGAAALCLAARLPEIHVIGVERVRTLAALAARNAAAAPFSARIRIAAADITDREALAELAPCDHVMANPPHLPPRRGALCGTRRAATVEDGADLADWAAAALTLLRPRGSLTFIHRADRLDDLLAALRGKAGGIIVHPLWPKRGRAAKRVLVSARKQINTPLTLSPGLVLHEPDGRFTHAAEAVLRHAGPLPLAASPRTRPC